jgi:signal peptide peptidase SppA
LPPETLPPETLNTLRDDSPLLSLGVPHLDQYFGVWSILEEPFRAAVARAKQINLQLHVAQAREQAQAEQAKSADGDSAGRGKRYQMAGQVAVIQMSGVLMKFASSLSSGTGTVAVRRAIRAAVADDDVGAIALVIDSPGGTVSGTSDLADDVAAAAAKKPVYAFIEDLGASAAYWVASQASKIFAANATTIVGSIGTFAVIEDSSGAAAMEGVKVHVLRAGEFKGGSVAGAPVEQKTLAWWQEMVNNQNEQFIRGVAQGRGMTLARVRELADGRAHVGQAAADLGLVDGIQSFDTTLGQLQKKAASTTTRRPKAMSTETAPQAVEQPRAATIHELKAGCPGADDAFCVAQLTANATLATAQAAWMAEQNRRLESARSEAEQARAAAAKPGTKALATAAATAAGDTAGSATEQWHALVQANIARGMRNDRAVRTAAIQHPEIHKAFIAEYNADTSARRAERAAQTEAEFSARQRG